jgi:hypothetical protein
MKILGEANYRALAKINPKRDIQLRGNPEKLIMLPNKDFQFQSSFTNILSFSSIYNLTKNKNDLIKITSQ